jgi:hypothetical protein
MSHANQYLAFGTGVGSNTLSNAAYVAAESGNLIPLGFQPGIAKSEQVNTVLRQATVAVAALAQFAADYGTSDVNDDGSVTNFKAALKSALDALYVFNPSALVPLSSFTGGNQSLGTNGWQKFPGGLIEQWITVTFTDVPSGTSGYQATINLPIGFPAAFDSYMFAFGGTAGNLNNWQVMCTGKTRNGGPSSVATIDIQIEEWSSGVNPGSLTIWARGH